VTRLDLLLETADLRLSLAPGGSDCLVLAFTGVGQALGGLQTEEFVGTSAGAGVNTALFVTDLQRSWYNAPGLIETAVQAIEQVRSTRQFGRVVAIGNSMGGYGAILFSAYVSMDVAIGFAPQFSVHPRIVPRETRWRSYTSRISCFRHDDLSRAFVERTRYFIFHGDGREERRQHRLFPAGPNICHLILPRADHDAAKLLKKRGLLKPAVDACIANEPERLRALLRECRAFSPGERSRRFVWPFRGRAPSL
jgi:hypothetical protein